VAEKTRGRYQGRDIVHVPLEVVRHSPDAVANQLLEVRGAQPVVVDAVTDVIATHRR